ncbi:Forkhead-associated (FHA) domain-containing protein [Pochonia chlamydosporia 170]|uniref:Forkhead-associated (FHA) domain-containing protein n=1 Tax=Pochonia chlamydosporia 170 TaxID=1380566 RepID=A0A179FLN2_METCM|nr:Forkhead-associated (FHA) domain-containing protein [Pochonia chlamydosporia 170]OAQ66464.1 Forkhead-associated (FHA) domain-containing protein [Pochonia chlamydosporia 170]
MAPTDDYDHKSSKRSVRDDDREKGSSHRRSRNSPDGGRHERRRSRDRRRRSRTPDSPDRHRRRRDRGSDRDPERDHGSGPDSRGSRRERSRDNGHSDRRRRRRDHDDQEDNDRKDRRGPVKRGGPLPSQADSFAITKGEEPEKPKEKPNFGNSGSLAAASNSVAQADGTSIILKYHEPSEARKPPARDQWKLFVFKGGDIVDTIDLSLRSCWLVGREMAVVDLPAEHPSISKQHAVIQFRYTEKRNEYGDKIGRVKPYLIDLESANGTILNDSKVPESRYLELRDKDMIQFGNSTREYVVMLAPKD